MTQAQLCAMQSLVLRESGDATSESSIIVLGAALPARLVRPLPGGADLHEARRALEGSEDRNRRREGLIGEYVKCHFLEDCAQDWKNANEERWRGLARRALAIERMRSGDDDFLDGHLALAELERADPARAAQIEASADPADILGHFARLEGPRSAIDSLAFYLLGAAAD